MQGFGDGCVGVFQLRVLAHKGDLHKLADVIVTVGQVSPLPHKLLGARDTDVELETLVDHLDEPLLFQHERNAERRCTVMDAKHLERNS